MQIIFLRGNNFSYLKKYSALEKNIPCYKKILRAKQKYSDIFFCAQYFFKAQMPQILEVVKKSGMRDSLGTCGGRGVCGEPMTARVMKQL